MASKTGGVLLAALASASLGLGLSSMAYAHGSEHHSRKPGAVQKEQKEWGIAGELKSAGRTVEVRMSDNMRFSPDRIEVRLNETVRFRVHNTGKVMHEFVIGTKAENAKHAELMLKFPNMEHDEPYMAHVEPGQTGEIIWTFNRAGQFEFACLIAGHFQAGMVGTIMVAQAPSGEQVDGEVRRVDKDAGKLTVRHGEIKSLDMPPMTMVFQVRDAALLDKVKPGDQVKFSVEKSGSAYVITGIEPVR
ncbi:MAG: hypothetical protein RI906_3547 [Pseudomonadota bacterium]|jgi:uncharacterized cupredoxin-like copper-binding protein